MTLLFTMQKALVTFSLKLMLKAYVRYFSNFYFSPNDSPLKTEKCFLFHLKSLFRS